MLIRMVESNTPSVNKSPSPELFSLIKAAATNLMSFGELWQSIKKKGKDEGFSERELQDLLRPLLKPQLNKDQIYYLFNADQRKEKSKEQYRNITTNVQKNVLPPEEPPKDPPPVEPKEDPLEIENEFLKEKVGHLEEALKNTEQFKPATQLQQQEPATDEHYFKWLVDKADGIHSFYYDTYGIDLFKNRELSQLKNSGVKVFKRLYFEV